MKKICCSLLLLLFTFICLFATIPKNKVSANTATSIPDKISTYYPYYAPQNVEFIYNQSSLNYTYDYSYDYYGSSNFYNPTTEYNSYINYGGATISDFYYSTIIQYNGNVVSNYWSELNNTYNTDTYFETWIYFDQSPTPNEDMVINLEFPVHSYDPVLLKDLYGKSLFSMDLGVIDCPCLITYDLYFTFPGRANAGDTSNYETHRFVDSYTVDLQRGYNDFTIFNTSRFYSLIQTFPNIHERIINIYGSITLTLYDYRDYLLDTFYPKLRTLAHDIRSYNTTELLENYGGGSFPNFFIENGYFNPNGLPSSGGGNANDNFIPSLATSLLNGVNNFMSFEISPGFSLGNLLALIVGIPLLILILKLFLGG